MRIFQALLFAGIIWSSPVTAHEYYLMPDTFEPVVSKPFPLRHRLGQKFEGGEIPYIGRWNERSEIWVEGKKYEARGKDGDRPALTLTIAKPGLAIAVHRSNVDFLTFKTWEKFVTYTEKEGISYAQKASEEGKKPKIKLKEAYSRFAKSLIQVDGSSAGNDQATGLKIELVAQKNPYALTADEALPVQLLYDGKPLAGATVKVFEKVGEEFQHKHITDENGMVQIKPAGTGPYLLNAIHITEPQSEEAKNKNAHWESFWASMTFARKQ